MSRKDVIIVACLLNVALFMILFATASVWQEADEEQAAPPAAPVIAVQEHVVSQEMVAADPWPQKLTPVDEIDEVVQEYTKRRDVITQAAPPVAAPVNKEVISEVVVRKGDVLSKIAKAHGMSTEELMRVNNLTSTKLKIGQVLKIRKMVAEKKVEMTPSGSADGNAYYVVQGGDNPWKIARKCKIDYDELLRLNNLNEEKAKNLKVGQKLRIR